MTLADVHVSARGHSLPLGETGSGHTGHTANRVSPYARRRARAREAWLSIPFGIRFAGTIGLLAALLGFLVLRLFPGTWVVSGIAAAAGVLAVAIAASVWTGGRP